MKVSLQLTFYRKVSLLSIEFMNCDAHNKVKERSDKKDRL